MLGRRYTVKNLLLRYWAALQAPDPPIGMGPARYWTLMFVMGLVAVLFIIYR